jgi:aminoglycoside phosphotransferase (APT) family kinase protein
LTDLVRPAALDDAEQGAHVLRAALMGMGLVGAHQPIGVEPLAGGVSSDIYRVQLPSGVIVCVKRALPKLKVAAEWRAPVERSRWEAEWMRVAAEIVPGAVPTLLGEDERSGCFAMEYLEPLDYPVWKALLAAGTIDLATAQSVGHVLGRIHAATADRADLATRFATDAIFDAIRLEPYLAATGAAHPRLAPRLASLAETTRKHKRVLVHGDFSPKNILVGRRGPVILDAECAWYGDPAFDLAFVLNHLLLKSVWRPVDRARYLAAYRRLAEAYFSHVAWEAREALEARTAALLPGLTLARIDGKSPVEYITEVRVKDRIRALAGALLSEPPATLTSIAARWPASWDG